MQNNCHSHLGAAFYVSTEREQEKCFANVFGADILTQTPLSNCLSLVCCLTTNNRLIHAWWSISIIAFSKFLAQDNDFPAF